MNALSLPVFYQITPEPVNPPQFEVFLEQLSITLESGIKLVQLRAKQLASNEHIIVAQKALNVCREHGAAMIFNGPIEVAVALGCDGVHLTSHALMSLEKRPLHNKIFISAACHNATQLKQAHQIGADFVTLSPVLPTQTHPEAHPLGWEKFATLVSGAQTPVFALGGMRPEMLDQVKSLGAYGIAAIHSTWRTHLSVEAH